MAKELVSVLEKNNLLQYITEVNKIPMLTEEEENKYSLLKEQGDVNAAKILVSSYLRLVVKIAARYSNYGLPMLDLISEGNIGLMRAVKGFDPHKGYRLATYAMWWIRATIQEYILRSWSLVKIGTNSVQKKLFFNLRRIKNKILKAEQKSLTNDQAEEIAGYLNLKAEEVLDMDKRLAKSDISLNKRVSKEDGDSGELGDFISAKQALQDSVIDSRREKGINQKLLKNALNSLNERERDILYARKLNENPLTLQELSKKYNISGERIRQIETAALEKVKEFFLSQKSLAC